MDSAEILQRRYFAQLIQRLGHETETADPCLVRSDRDLEAVEVYADQMLSRITQTPGGSILRRCQNIWGRDFISGLLRIYYQDYPARSADLAVTLAALPNFVLAHPDFSRVLGLSDLLRCCLSSWSLMHERDPESIQYFQGPAADLSSMSWSPFAFYFEPIDELDLFRLWLSSEQPAQGDPGKFWREMQENGPRALVLKKAGASQLDAYTIDRALVPLLQPLLSSLDLAQTLDGLSADAAQSLAPLLAHAIAEWVQNGLLCRLQMT